MPNYELVFRDADEEEHLYIKWAKSEKDLANFTPFVLNEDDLLVPLGSPKVVSVKEIETRTIVQLDLKSWQKVRSMARTKGLKEQKAEGAWCLEIRGKGEWMEEDWIKELKIIGTNWMF